MNRRLITRVALLMMVALTLSKAAAADTLRLKNGQWVQGNYAGGNSTSIRFEVNGATRTYSISEVDRIEFSGSTSYGTYGSGTGNPVAGSLVRFNNEWLSIDRPGDWQVIQDGSTWTIAPRSGQVRDSQGLLSLSHGVTIDLFDSYSAPYSTGLQSGSAGLRNSIQDRTNALIDDLRRSNPNLRRTGTAQNIRIDGRDALSLRLSNDSPIGGLETNWLITTQHNDGLLYIIFTAPERDFPNYERLYQQMLNSARWNQSGASRF